MTFEDALMRIPAPGTGVGTHPYLMTVANIGAREGISELIMVQQILDNIPEGNRIISHKEVADTVRKALHDLNGSQFRGRAHGAPLASFRKTNSAMLAKFLHPQKLLPEDFIASSPIPIDPTNGQQQLHAVLSHLYEPDDMVFIGEYRSNGVKRIAPASGWCSTIQRFPIERIPNYIIWNPLSGEPAPLTGGNGMSLRCDNAVVKYRYAMVEFDNISLHQQLRFWGGCRLPVAALVYSGKKSIHGVVALPKTVRTLKDWDMHVRKALYQRWLVPLGVDRACSNPSRLSRCPGVQRDGVMQKLFYLDPAAGSLYLNNPLEDREVDYEGYDEDNLQIPEQEDEEIDDVDE